MATKLTDGVTVSIHRAQRAAIELLAAFAIVLGAVSLGHCNSGCALFKDKEPTPPTVNEVQYSSELAACVDNANSVSESRKCRNDVSRRWGLCTKTDGVERCP